MPPFDAVMVALATFYASYVLTNTKGPFDAFLRLRERFPMGGLLTCIYCVALWLALAFYGLSLTPLSWLVTVFGAAGAGMFVYRFSGGQHV